MSLWTNQFDAGIDAAFGVREVKVDGKKFLQMDIKCEGQIQG